jgi:hypothetical protein
MIIGRSSVFYADRKSKMAATTGHSINTGPLWWGKYRNIFFSEAIALIEPKLCINHWKVLYKLCVFYVDRNSKMTTTAGHSFYIGPIGSFYNQVNDTGSWEPLVYICIAIGDPVIKRGGLGSQVRTWNSNVICRDLFCVQWVKVRDDCSYCWYWCFQ